MIEVDKSCYIESIEYNIPSVMIKNRNPDTHTHTHTHPQIIRFHKILKTYGQLSAIYCGMEEFKW